MKRAYSSIITACLLFAFGSAATAGTGCTGDSKRFQPSSVSTKLSGPKTVASSADKRPAPSIRSGSTKTVVDVAVSAGTLNTLLAALQSAGLVDTLVGDRPITLFAPTDAAFAKLPEGSLNALLADKPKLIQVLTYHMVPGKVPADAVERTERLDTVAGSALPVGNINIAEANIKAANGVIHLIDQVLIPEG